MTDFYRARYVLDELRFHDDAILEVDGDRIAGIHQEVPGDVEVTDLGEVAILPGLINGHSHAFQRAIRGRTEYLDRSRAEDDFWTWREQMYRAALRFSPEELEGISRLCFTEMALSGITTVGEFHYIHHQPDGSLYDDPNELAHRVIRAARDVGIRIVLLRVAYHRAGYEQPADPMQRRFVEDDVDGYLARASALRKAYADEPAVGVGLAPHSIRAVPFEWLRDIGAAAATMDAPLHIHACEQWREIEESIDEYGAPPIIVFDEMGLLDERLTLVHGTHVSTQEFDAMSRGRPTVCACPTTERNLGDGFLPASHLFGADVPISLGSDSQTNIDLWEEMRLVEYHERLQHRGRNVLASVAHEQRPASEGTIQTADLLFPMATAHGARSLQMEAGVLAPGKLADFITVDLGHISLAKTSRDTLLTDLCMTAPPGVVRDVFVGGEKIVENGECSR